MQSSSAVLLLFAMLNGRHRQLEIKLEKYINCAILLLLLALLGNPLECLLIASIFHLIACPKSPTIEIEFIKYRVPNLLVLLHACLPGRLYKSGHNSN